MPRQHYTNFPDIAQEKSRSNIEQKDKIVRNSFTVDSATRLSGKQTLKPNYIVSSSEIKTENKKMTLSKWQRRWNNAKDNIYKNIVPTISKEELKQCALHLKHTSRK